MTKTHKTLLTAGAALLPGLLQAAIVGPYAPDASTLHLWQFNEASGTTAASSMGSGSFALTAVNGATLGNTSFTGFGNAGYTGGGTDDAFQGNNIKPSAVVGAGGAFTYEALINLSDLGGTQEIIALDNSSSTSARPFQFVIKNGTDLIFTNIGGPSVENMVGTIPTGADADAFAAGVWFHVAVTYNGLENTADNFKIYWTKLDASRTAANEIASLQMVYDLPSDAQAAGSVLGVGNEFRGSPNENVHGYLDEVRISGIAREAGDMMFAVPEPATFAFLAGGLALGLAVWRRRR